ncbi:phage terminase-like protein, large subunit, partial [Gottschalkia purinilytica]
ALDYPEKMRNFLTKNMNRWVDMRDGGYMDMSKWREAGEEYNFENLEGEECIVGMDLSTKLDLTSVGFEFKVDNQYKILSHSFIPEETYNQKLREGKLPWSYWVEKGWLTVTPGSVIDYSYIKKYIKEKEEKYGITVKEVCYDPWNATQFAQDMSLEGYTMIEIRQGIKTLSEPCNNFREEVYSGNLKHNNNDLLTWAVGNSVVKQDANQNIMLDKSKSAEKIDPIASIINAHVRARTELESYGELVDVWSF